MKKNFIIGLFSFGSFLLLLAGCAPQLAQTKYGTVENQWKEYIQQSYSDWTPPPTPPPINNVSPTGNSFITEAAPEPADSSALPEITTTGQQPTAAISSKAQTYTVQKGDTLWSISRKFYNDGTKWKNIQNANKDALPSPGKLRPGLVLTIPAN